MKRPDKQYKTRSGACLPLEANFREAPVPAAPRPFSAANPSLSRLWACPSVRPRSRDSASHGTADAGASSVGVSFASKVTRTAGRPRRLTIGGALILLTRLDWPFTTQ